MTTETAAEAQAAMAPVAESRARRPVTARGGDEPAAERFRRSTAAHEMTVLHDEGLYRHLRFRQPDDPESKRWTGAYWFDLITWPGCLAINGDMDSFLFSRETDMFTFFRGHQPNPGYWAEKVRAGSDIKRYSEDRFRQLVTEYAAEAEEDWPGLSGTAERDIFGESSGWNTGCEDGAREALRDFGYGDTFSVKCSCGDHAEGLAYLAAEQRRVGHYPMTDRLSAHITEITRVEGFRFADAREWDLSDYTWQFLWCCHAIPWGIAQYDNHAKAAS